MNKDQFCVFLLAAVFIAFNVSCSGALGSHPLNTPLPAPAVCDPGQATEILSTTIHNSGADDLKNYALAIPFDRNIFDFALASGDGHDLAVWDAVAKSAIPFWLESYDSQVGKAIIWVKIPDLKAGTSQVIWITSGVIPHCSAEIGNGYAVFPFLAT